MNNRTPSTAPFHFDDRIRCHDCGRFTRYATGAAWQMVYSGFPPEPDREIVRCQSCVRALGPFEPQLGIRPEYSCGMVIS